MASLRGLRILVTRPERQAGGMMTGLRAAGAEPILFPAIRVTDAADGGAALRRAAGEIDAFDWVVVTSANGAERVIDALGAADGKAVRWACVGPATAGVLEAAGLEPDVIAARPLAEGLLEALAGRIEPGSKVLLAQASGARRVIADGLRAAGVDLRVVEAYRTEADLRGARDVRGRLDRGEIDVVTFTSSSTVERFVDAVGRDIGRARVAVIGPVTGTTAASAGLGPDIVAGRHTVEGLIEALLAFFDNDGRSDQT